MQRVIPAVALGLALGCQRGAPPPEVDGALRHTPEVRGGHVTHPPDSVRLPEVHRGRPEAGGSRVPEVRPVGDSSTLAG